MSSSRPFSAASATLATWLCSLGLAWLLPSVPTRADALARAELSVSSFTITPAPGPGVLILDPWFVEGFSEALNSLGELSQDFTFADSFALPASVTYAAAHSSADVAALPPDPWGAVSALADIPGSLNLASAAVGRLAFSTTLLFSGSLDPVELTFAGLASGILELATDAFGVEAGGELILALSLDGDEDVPIFIGQTIGPSDGFLQTFTDSPWSIVRSIEPDRPYFLRLELDAEARAVTAPEASAILPAALLACLLTIGALRQMGFRPLKLRSPPA